jgi:hypothetical protein
VFRTAEGAGGIYSDSLDDLVLDGVGASGGLLLSNKAEAKFKAPFVKGPPMADIPRFGWPDEVPGDTTSVVGLARNCDSSNVTVRPASVEGKVANVEVWEEIDEVAELIVFVGAGACNLEEVVGV